MYVVRRIDGNTHGKLEYNVHVLNNEIEQLKQWLGIRLSTGYASYDNLHTYRLSIYRGNTNFLFVGHWTRNVLFI